MIYCRIVEFIWELWLLWYGAIAPKMALFVMGGHVFDGNVGHDGKLARGVRACGRGGGMGLVFWGGFSRWLLLLVFPCTRVRMDCGTLMRSACDSDTFYHIDEGL
jgi:hypothetical protein